MQTNALKVPSRKTSQEAQEALRKLHATTFVRPARNSSSARVDTLSNPMIAVAPEAPS